jgi:predicted peptidase
MRTRPAFTTVGVGVSVIVLTASGCGSRRGEVSVTRLTQQFALIREHGERYRVNYWQYLPPGPYRTRAPVLIFLHGFAARAVGSDRAELTRVLANGPPMLVDRGNDLCFSVEEKRSCFLMLAPQAPFRHDWFGPSVVPIVDTMIDRALALGADPRRVYLTGLSMGAIGTWSYAAALDPRSGRIAGSRLAAIVPIAGSANTRLACNIAQAAVAVWAFHGTADDTVYPRGSTSEIQAINTCKHPRASYRPILTLYPGVGHDSWTRTYDPASRFDPHTGKRDARGINIYQWLLTHTRRAR